VASPADYAKSIASQSRFENVAFAMVIHTGGQKNKGVGAGRSTADRGGVATQFADSDVFQFAPNFSVYVLPNDVVCLYSDHRKFFLHGQLYSALAITIDTGKRFGQIVRELSRKFPPDKIGEAVNRLIERRYLVRKTNSSAGVAAAYWANLGLAPDVAEQNLGKCRVRIQAINVKGAKELAATLRKLDVRVVKGAADLTVTIVNDYFEGELAALNRKHLSDHSAWLLMQPSGIFPLVGPVFRPGQSGCWACLADRMKRNREVKAMLERKQARRVVVSPLTQDTLGQTGIEFGALEIAKAIATGFRTDLSDHILSLDLLGSAIAKHYVAARPQCPSCGQKKLRDPRRAPVPITLAAGANLIETSGGFRTVPSRATVARFRKHVSPLTGVVSRLEPINADLPLNTNYFAMHNFSAPAESVDQLREGLSGGSFGKGSTAEQGEASALMEAIERYSGIFQGDETRVTKRFTDFAPGAAIAPNDVLLFSDAQYRRGLPPAMGHDVTPTAPRFDPSAKIEWSPVWSLRDECFRYLPTSLLYFFYTGGLAASYIHADSNGCAAGNTIEEAIVQGFLELVERDSYAIWWYNRSQRSELDLSRFDDPYVRDLKVQLANTGRRLWVLDITSDLGIPSFVALSHAVQNGHDFVEYGSGAHFDPRIALLRALTEVNQFLSIGLMGARNAAPSHGDGAPPFYLRDHPYLTPNEQLPVRPDLSSNFGTLDKREQVMACVKLAKRQGLDFLVLDQTRPDIEVPVVRVIVPGLRHFYRRFARGRLYDVPVKLKLRDRPLSENELNPLHPQT
jgi:bacteriocin biosynthesis cyclodehydratase domain-containing protein